MKLKRITAALLLFAMLLSCLPLGVSATDDENRFYFSAETSKTLVVSPQKIPYSDDQTIAEALTAAGIMLTIDSGSSFVTAINGVSGKYLYCGDFSAEQGLALPAGSVHYLFFTEDLTAALTDGRKTLMRAMADYLAEDPDVQNAAKTPYQAASAAYPGISDADAQRCADAITTAIAEYRASLTGGYEITFSGYTGGNYEVYAENKFGKRFTDTGHPGVLTLPMGDGYTFCIRQGIRQVSGALNVSGPATIQAALPASDDWFNETAFQISAESGNDFKAIACTIRDHTVAVLVPDVLSGDLCPYIELNKPYTKAATVTALYSDASGKPQEKIIPEFVKTTSLPNVLSRGAAGNTVILRASITGTDGYDQSVDLTLRLDRMPTLASLRVTNAAETAQAADKAFSPTDTEYTYQIVDTAKELRIYPTATLTGSAVTVSSNGTNYPLGEKGGATVPVSGNTDVTVSVKNSAYETAYTLHIQPVKGQSVKLILKDADELEVRNKNGEVLAYTSVLELGKPVYTYTLVPNETYSYVATKNTWYHAKKDFTLSDVGSGLTMAVEVTAGDWLTELTLDVPFDGGTSFTPAQHTYSATYWDATVTPSAQAAQQNEDGDSLGPVCVIYPTQSTKQPETPQQIDLSSGESTHLNWAVLNGSAHENTLTFRASRYDAATKITSYTDYQVTLKRSLSLESLSASANGVSVPLRYQTASGTQAEGYKATQSDYTVLVPAAARSLDLKLQAHGKLPKYGDEDVGYLVDGTPLPEDQTSSTRPVYELSLPLNGSGSTETLRFTLTNRHNETAKTVYTITVQKAAATSVRFQTTPKDALICVIESGSNQRVWPEDGVFALSEGFTYLYSITSPGYIGQGGEMTLSTENGVQKLTMGGKTYSDLSNVAISLQTAQKNTTLDTTLSAEWADFRGTAYVKGQMAAGGNSNNAVTDAPTPISAAEGTLYWAVHLGSSATGSGSMGGGSVSNPILVNDELIVYAGSTLYRINKDTGETIKTGKMAGSSSFSINGPTYADGMIFVALTNGVVQAFDADSLESLWIYHDPLKGQPNCPITVSNGYAYTGFWNSETRDASFVCLPIADERPTASNEEKYAAWRHVQTGGFYWAGACVQNGVLLVGTDDGQDSTSPVLSTGRVLLFDAATGALLDEVGGICGDVRSTICYDSGSNAYYATSKGGEFIRIKLDATGRKIDSKQTLKLQNGTTSVAMSTSTPVVYKGRAYVGVSGSSQFYAYSGHNITVIDLDGAMSIAYRVPTKGYPQASGLLTTAYENDENGGVYVYFAENTIPGTIRLLYDRKGQTSPALTTMESGKKVAYALFSPSSGHAEHCICSLIADAEGTIYFKNDSGHLMAYGRMLEGMEIESQPTKTTYAPGETFDTAGLTAVGDFGRGVKRDVTAYLIPPADAIQAGDTSVTLKYGKGLTMYQNQPDGNGGMVSNPTTSPTLKVDIRVDSGQTDGKIGDITWHWKSTTGVLTVDTIPEGQMLFAACYDANGRVTKALPLTAGANDLVKDSAQIKLFLLDSKLAPLCDAKLVIKE